MRDDAEVTSAARPEFRPSIVTRVGTSWVVLDDLQPRALVVTADEDAEAPRGRLLAWPDRPAPVGLRWPSRTAVARDDAVWVSDGPGTQSVCLRADPVLGVVLADGAGPVPSGSDVRVARSRFSWSRELTAASGGLWNAATVVSGIRFDARVGWGAPDVDSRTWDLGRGAVVGCAVSGEHLVVTVRRADKRPWRFRPRADIALLHPRCSVPRWIRPPGEAELRGTTWPVAPVDPGAVEAAVRSAEGAAEAVTRRGGGDVAVSVSTEQVGALALPVVTTTFTHPLRPGVRCARRDEPVSELGLSTGGLEGMAILLEEDLVTGFLPGREENRDGVLAV